MAKYHVTTEQGAVHYIDTDEKLWIRKAAKDSQDFEPAEITWVGGGPEIKLGYPLACTWLTEKGRPLYRITTPVVHVEVIE